MVRTSEKLEDSKSSQVRLENELSLMSNNMAIQWDSEDTIIDDNIFISSQDGDTLNLSELMYSDVTTLYFRYSSGFCQLCVDQEIKNLNALKKKNPGMRIIGLSNFNEFGDFLKYSKIKSINFENYNLINRLNLEVEKLYIPYVFVVYPKSQVINSLFVPSKDIPQNSSSYYNIVTRKFF